MDQQGKKDKGQWTADRYVHITNNEREERKGTRQEAEGDPCMYKQMCA